MKLSIIIPVYNEEKTIGEVLKKVVAVGIPHVEKEIIVVDDGSTDRTVESIKYYVSSIKNKNIKFLKHVKNQGKGAAVRTGIGKASGDYIIIQDADLEYNPNSIPRLLEPIISGEAQIVYGSRLKRWPHLWAEESNPRFLLHYFGNRLLSLLTSILYGQFLTDMETGYKLFPKQAVSEMRLNSKRFDFEPEITAKLLKSGYKILEVPIKTKPRGYNEGKKLHTLKDGSLALWTLFKYRVVD